MAHNHPMTRVMKRGGSYRRCYFVQPYLNPNGPSCTDIYRCVRMDLVTA